MNVPNPLSAEAIQTALASCRRSLGLGPEVPVLGHRIEIHGEIASSNDRIDQLGAEGHPEGTVVFAEHQTAGRGRGNNRWSAPPGRNLTFSVLLRPPWPMEHWSRCAHAAGLAVARGVEPWLGGLPARLKWPNDVHADERKLAGILLEMKGSRDRAYLVAGIGINVHSTAEEFPPELRESLVSVGLLAGGSPVDRNHLAGAVLAELAGLYARCGDDFDGVLEEIRTRSLLLGRAIRFSRQGRWEEGELVDFGPGGEMLVRLAGGDGLESVAAAECVRLKNH